MLQKIYRAIVITCILAFPPRFVSADTITAQSIADSTTPQSMQTQVNQALSSGNYQVVEDARKLLNKSKATFDFDTTKLSIFYQAITDINDQPEGVALSQAWHSSKINSPIPFYRTAIQAFNAAFDSRGELFSQYVPSPNWEAFAKNINKAYSEIKLALNSPEPDPVLYNLAYTLSFHAHDKNALSYFDKGINIDPFYFPLYQSVVHYLSPKWSGQTGLIGPFADKAVEKTKDKIGYGAYHVATAKYVMEMRKVAAEEGGVDFKKCTQGIQDLISRNICTNKWCYAYLAFISYLANDYKTSREAFKKIDNKYDPEFENIYNDENYFNEYIKVVSTADNFEDMGIVKHAGYGEIEAVRLALKKNPQSINTLDQEGNTALTAAFKNRQYQLFHELLKLGADPNLGKITEFSPPILFSAIKENMLDIAQALIKAGADPNVRGIQNYTPLHIAAIYGNVKITKLLLGAKNIDVNIPISNDDTRTPLFLAVQFNQKGTLIELLNDKRVELDVICKVEDQEKTPLMEAVLGIKPDLAKALISKGAKQDLTYTDIEGNKKPISDLIRDSSSSEIRSLSSIASAKRS